MGGFVALALACVILAILAKNGVFISTSDGDIETYEEMELLQYEIREGGVWVRYKNIGDKVASAAIFKIKVYDKDKNLIDEFEEAVYEESSPGETKENIVKLIRFSSGEAISLKDRNIDVAFKYGYLQ